MKNLKLHELVIVAIICVLICLEFAIIGREIIGISGDFLTAGTTLFAAFVAYLIFIDWRDEHRFRLLEQYQNVLKEQSAFILAQYHQALRNFSLIEVSSPEDAEARFNEGKLALDNIKKAISKSPYHISQYMRCLKSFPNSDVLQEKIDVLNQQAVQIAKIRFAYVPLTVKFARGPENSTDILSVIKNWAPMVEGLNNFCEIDLTNLYFELLNKE